MTEHGTSFTTEHSKDSFMSFDQMMNNHRNQSPTPPQTLHHSNSSQNPSKSNFMNGFLLNQQPQTHNHNMVLNAHYQHNPHFSHSPQPQVHHYNNFNQNQGNFSLKPMGQH
eukprot:TRINITY_DN21996_c0_g1_i2.p1 TRINITY_DN21996_c0_g1~~TRINITY_DN21996_c0_g1_i2.p1  ORF type:complete len:111 (+),score=9.91 TRINITY_DN21996_c0_g1_i2:427-759(+)